MKVKVEKLFNGFASIRDYIWRDTVRKRENLIIEYKGKQMTIPCNRNNVFQVHRRKFASKWGGVYELIDFRFCPDETKQKVFNFKEEK